MDRNNIMTLISRAVIIIPLAIILVAVMIKFNQPDNNYPLTKISLSPSPVLFPTQVASAEAKLDLHGPYICSYQDKDSSISAYIQNQQILVKINQNKSTQNLLVKDDCYYSWSNLKTKGEKKCGGITQIMSLVNIMLGMNNLNLSSFASYLSDKNLNVSQSQFQAILNSCRKEEIKNNQFILPKSVTFSQK